jgi:hypothetical protein
MGAGSADNYVEDVNSLVTRVSAGRIYGPFNLRVAF